MFSTNNHPIIPTPPAIIRDVTDPNVDTFFATISSLDRNVVKYPQMNSFTVDLPQEYTNVTSMSLQHTFFPQVNVAFTLDKNNVDLVFRFTDMDTTTNNTDIESMIYVFVKQSIANNNYFRVRITDGSYTQEQLLLEVQNRMNQLVTDSMLDYYNSDPQTTYSWGDYVYSASPYATNDGHILMFHPNYTTYAEAVAACNSMAGAVVPLNLVDLNTFARTYGSTLTPPPMLAIPTVSDSTDMFLGPNAYANISVPPSTTYYDYVNTLLTSQGGYGYFKLFYDQIQKRTIFGNSISVFEVVLDFTKYYSVDALNVGNIRHSSANTSSCTSTCNSSKVIHTNYVNWGLPVYMGFSGKERMIEYAAKTPIPTFYYYNKITNPDLYNPFRHETTSGFSHLSIYLLTPCNQLNLEGDVYYYMELDGLNMIDELLPYKNDAYAVTNGTTTGIVNSVFAKRTILTDRSDRCNIGQGEEKTFTPALRRMNKVSVRIRYHDGREPNFGSTPFDFTLKIVCQKNQLGRSSNPGFPAPA